MSSENKMETTQQQPPKTKGATSLKKTGVKEDVELSEKELGRVAGGTVFKDSPMES